MPSARCRHLVLPLYCWVKGWFRSAKALQGLGRIQQALQAADQALQLEPGNRDVSAGGAAQAGWVVSNRLQRGAERDRAKKKSTAQHCFTAGLQVLHIVQQSDMIDGLPIETIAVVSVHHILHPWLQKILQGR